MGYIRGGQKSPEWEPELHCLLLAPCDTTENSQSCNTWEMVKFWREHSHQKKVGKGAKINNTTFKRMLMHAYDKGYWQTYRSLPLPPTPYRTPKAELWAMPDLENNSKVIKHHL